MNTWLERSLVDLVKTYSPTGREYRATDKFCDYLNEAGATDVRKDAAGNATGVMKGSGLSVTLCGHIDTVPGRLPVKVNDGYLYGRGAVDAKSSLISLLHGASLAKDRGFSGTLNVVAAVGEEGPSKGILEVASSARKTDYAILGEPSGTTGITTGYRGRLLLDVKFKTGSHHASAPWMGTNAIDAAIESWGRIKERYGESREFSKVSVALTSLKGGTADNVIPSTSSMTLDVRYPPSMRRNDLVEAFKALVYPEEMDGYGELSLRSFVDPYVSNMKTPLVQAFKKSISTNTGRQPAMIFKSGSGDMNILGAEWKVPCITYGPGNTQLSHTNVEMISLDEVERSAEVVSDALLNLEEMHNREN